jgi:hypothetical protein
MPSFTRVGAHITTSVDVELKAVGLTSISFALRYDRSRLRLISVNVGELLSQSGAASSFTYDDPAPGGEIHGTLTAKSGGSGVAGAGSVVSAEFEAIAEGTAIISLQGLQIIRVNDQSSPVGSVAAQTITIGPKIDVPMVQFGNR